MERVFCRDSRINIGILSANLEITCGVGTYWILNERCRIMFKAMNYFLLQRWSCSYFHFYDWVVELWWPVSAVVQKCNNNYSTRQNWFILGRMETLRNPQLTHDDVIKWKRFPRYWLSVRGIHRSPVNSPFKGQWRRALSFSLICAWQNACVNNREAGDLRRHYAHYDIIAMKHPNRLNKRNIFDKSDKKCDSSIVTERN